jgi:hypothetical protein
MDITRRRLLAAFAGLTAWARVPLVGTGNVTALPALPELLQGWGPPPGPPGDPARPPRAGDASGYYRAGDHVAYFRDFHRWLACDLCCRVFSAAQLLKDGLVGWEAPRFIGPCPGCHTPNDWRWFDVWVDGGRQGRWQKIGPTTSLTRDLEADRPGAYIEYVWEIPAGLRRRVLAGHPFELLTTPSEIIQAIAAGVDFHFAPGVLHRVA